MRKTLLTLLVTLTFGLVACSESTNEMEVRSEWFKKQELTQETALKAIDNFFDAQTFKITAFSLEEAGVVTMRLDVGPAQEQRALLLRTAATSYAFSRMLFSNPGISKITTEMHGSIEAIGKLTKRFHILTSSLTRDQAGEIHWNKMEEQVAQDHAYDPVLSQFNIVKFNTDFDAFIDPQLYHKIYGEAPKR